jgi:Tol biopolymer transport system component
MPDGNFVLYTAFASSPPTIWKAPIGGGSPERIPSSEQTSFALALSPNGKQLAVEFYVPEHRGYRVGIRPLESDAALVPLESGLPLYFTPDGKNLAFVDFAKPTNVFVMQLDGDKRRPITKFASDTIFSFALPPDGKRIALSRGTISTDVVLMTHLPAS